MDHSNRAAILRLLGEGRLMTVATIGPDGWPRAATVSYVNEGFAVYFICDPKSGRADNIGADNRICLTLAGDLRSANLSLGAHAFRVTDAVEKARIVKRLRRKFPEKEELHRPAPSELELIKAVPDMFALPGAEQPLDLGLQRRHAAEAQAMQRLSRLSLEHETNWQLRAPPKLRCRQRPLARALQLSHAH